MRVNRRGFLTGLTATTALAKEFRRTTYSFRNLSQREASRIRARRLIVVRTSGRDRVDSLSNGLPYGRYNRDWFHMLNDMGPRDRLRPGQNLKVVVG